MSVGSTKPPPKKSRGTLLLALGVALLVLAGGTAAAVLMLGGGGRRAEAADGAGSEDAAARGTAGETLVAFEPFVVNLADPRGDRFLRATIRVVLRDREIAAELQHDELTRTRVRDRILSVLASKTIEEVAGPGGKDSLRQQLLREINQALPDDVVTEVLFVEFVAQ